MSSRHVCVHVYVSLCMYTCLCVCTHVFVYVHMPLYMCTCLRMYTGLCACVRVFVHVHMSFCMYIFFVYVHVSLWMCTCICICVRVFVLVYVYLCVCTCICACVSKTADTLCHRNKIIGLIFVSLVASFSFLTKIQTYHSHPDETGNNVKCLTWSRQGNRQSRLSNSQSDTDSAHSVDNELAWFWRVP